MTWKIEITPRADRALRQIDRKEAERIRDFLYERIAPAEDPRSLGDALQGARMAGLWRYRVGGYRFVVHIEDEVVRIVVVRIGHRREVYRS
ncbi:mRNA interferase RelE/StbE [Murinocardiopsis flavida]|uniref:mRNA interferase RelE/StbE n=1 Tax=Murinocardiopsis flavida TaxID=645275 RepID=A0A2P8DMX2_9ACTN|nr:type II toxin-antitoxin system RelE/ParE family toxin [Murinocardiopsis flavida]PSK98556.1 mRNA interferase RelE/StbE [Murinocardiopsis flavida]